MLYLKNFITLVSVILSVIFVVLVSFILKIMIEPSGLTIDLIYIFMFYAILARPFKFNLIFIWFLGMLVDIVNSVYLGVNAIVFVIIGFIVFNNFSFYIGSNSYLKFSIVFLMFSFYKLVNLFFQPVSFSLLIDYSLLPIILNIMSNSIIIFIIIWFVQKNYTNKEW